MIPGEKIREEVRGLKEEFKERYGSKHALKSPAHITLQRPFRRAGNEEEKIVKTLEEFSQDQEQFEVELSGFDCFEPRVIFIKVNDHKKIQNLHLRLNQVLLKDLNFAEKEINTKIHPHITIATRDLDKIKFYRALDEFKDKEFEADFKVKSLFLLKHNGKFWDIYKEFSFYSGESG